MCLPRRAAAADAPSPEQRVLYEIAAGQSGYFTPADAREAGFSSPLVEYHVRTGRFERVRRGVFRLTQFPPSDSEDWMVAWLWSGKSGVFSHESALRAHGLSDVLPADKHLSVPSAWAHRRLRVPDGLILHHQDVAKAERTWFANVPITTPLRTVVDCVRDELMPDLVNQAISESLRRGLFSRAQITSALTKARLDVPKVSALRKVAKR